MKNYELKMTEKGELFFLICQKVFGTYGEVDVAIDPEDLREDLKDTDDPELRQLFFEFGVNEFIDVINSIGESEERDKIRKMQKKVVKYLKSEVIAYADLCGADDEISTIPAVRAYKNAKKVYRSIK